MTDGNIVEFPRPDAGDLYWKCGCGCSTFWARYDKRIECAACHLIIENYGEWIVPTVSAPPVKSEPTDAVRIVKLGTAEAVLRRVCDFAISDIGGTAAMIVMKDDGTVRTWNRKDFDTPTLRRWLREGLSRARRMITGETR